MKWLALILSLAASDAFANCRQALVLALDVSGSVDATEYQLQRDGLATALASAKVSQTLLASGRAPVDIAIFEWSGPNKQVLIQPWITISDRATLGRVTANLRNAPRVAGDLTTAIGSAMVFADALLADRTHCWQWTIDISGDGPANTGPRPQDLSPTDISPRTTINGLVIVTQDEAQPTSRSSDFADLPAYFRAYVMRGPAAFVEVANGFSDYANAMERKLLRELETIVIGQHTLGPSPLTQLSEVIVQ